MKAAIHVVQRKFVCLALIAFLTADVLAGPCAMKCKEVYDWVPTWWHTGGMHFTRKACHTAGTTGDCVVNGAVVECKVSWFYNMHYYVGTNCTVKCDSATPCLSNGYVEASCSVGDFVDIREWRYCDDPGPQ